MEDPVIKDLKIHFVYCIEVNFGDADMYDVADDEDKKWVLQVWSKYISQHMVEMRKLEEIRKVAIVAKGGENVVVEVDSQVLQQVEEILLLPFPQKGQGSETRKKVASSTSSNVNTNDWEILVKITASKWGDKPFYMGLGFHDLYWKWFLGNGHRYIFKTEKEKEMMGILPPNTRILTRKTSYQEMLGFEKKTTGKLNFEGRNFMTSLSQIYWCESEYAVKDDAFAYVVIYLIESVRFSALQKMDVNLFRLFKTDKHEWDDYIMAILNDWDDYSKQIFKDEGTIGTSNTFYSKRPFCNLENVKVADKSKIYRILAVALGTADSDEWVNMIQKAKDKTKSRKN